MAASDRYQFNADGLRVALELTGQLLAEREQSFEIVVIGGANLVLQGVVDRPTVDVDVVALRTGDDVGYQTAKPLPEALLVAVTDVADLLALPPRWLNGAASSDFQLGLPPGYETRVDIHRFGGLSVSFAHRQDIVAWKLQAAVDQWGTHPERHFEDLVRLAPTAAEIAAARDWFATVEAAGSGFWTNLDNVLGRLGHGG